MRAWTFIVGPVELPEGFLSAAAVVFAAVLIGSLVWGVVLQMQYARPYTLSQASSKQKWLWSIHLAFWSSVCLLDAGFFLLFLSLAGAPLGAIPNICINSFFVLFLLMIPTWRLSLQMQLDYYRYLSWRIRSGMQEQLLFSPLLRFRRSILGRISREHRRFYQEGYPDSGEPEKKS